MLVLEGPDGLTREIYVIDGHTHIGSEAVIEYGEESFRKNSPRQILDFYTSVKYSLFRMWKNEPDFFGFQLKKNFTRPSTYPGCISRRMFENRYEGWFVDQFVTFPFNDYRAKKTTPHFQIPNDLILKRMHSPPLSLRMLGYCRVDPFDDEAAIKEVRRCIAGGIKGLKLHPISQDFLDEINTKPVQEVTKYALNHHLPVIFDCRYSRTAEDIYEMYREIQGEVSFPRHGIILAHSGMEFDRQAIYEILQDPHMYGDTSGIRGDDVSFFFKQAYEHAPDTWFNSIIFGTDYNYFTEPQAIDLISHLLSRELLELTSASDQQIQAILAGNLLRLIPVRGLKPAEPSLQSSESEYPALQAHFVVKTKADEDKSILLELARDLGDSWQEKKIIIGSYDPVISPFGTILPDSFFTILAKDDGEFRVLLIMDENGIGLSRGGVHPEENNSKAIPVPDSSNTEQEQVSAPSTASEAPPSEVSFENGAIKSDPSNVLHLFLFSKDIFSSNESPRLYKEGSNFWQLVKTTIFKTRNQTEPSRGVSLIMNRLLADWEK